MKKISPTRSFAAVLLLGALVATAACTTPAESAGSIQAGHAQCLVCKSEGDLACVDVTIRSDTPRAQYAGRTYYFCSEQCRKDFLKDPERYLGQ